MALKAPSFLADAMLGSVARKLRIFGFDTLYIAHAHDDEILKMGIEQGRVILTADKELFKRVVKAGARGVLVSGASDLEDLVHILSKNGITSVDLDGIGSRCSVCNGLLEEKKPEQVKNGLPDKVAKMHREFYQCTVCNKVYWEGGHLRRIRALAKSVDSKLLLLGRTSATT
ncbi:hypothetical protein Ngar_c31880 [Candidatus Nitrososphaera gargensis Ga9.2]|uniref:Mut7-C RNAse domain-containing protein n=1 Tax=Nitrososphaera gargensis (strain Ga9.2) TaxID=1237085 RepID=K0INW9_NITGG|nr:Mut7-C RNAse domain-containing protein [Candidatus Nitrososphaera gargensis]AFU60104.1 hypothetical protein Ngar_c31880 [Candidatus Nitrososphaera gargensis Ga9.2]